MKAAANIANIAEDLSPEELTAITMDTLAASSQFTSAVTGDTVNNIVI